MRCSPPRLADLLAALKARRPVPPRMALVVAHPDDETIGAGASLRLMPELVLIHVTDGAPRRNGDAARAGFHTPAAYAAARRSELGAALAVSGTRPTCLALDVPDQEAALQLAALTAALAAAFVRHRVTAVLTHAYEGGHPDHDATAFAAHRSARGLGLPVLEFPAYHAGAGPGTTAQRFLAGPPEMRVPLSGAEAGQKREMLACFRSQAATLLMFEAEAERFRPAPLYDFREPPHFGPLNYEAWGWEMTGARWRELARAALRCAV